MLFCKELINSLLNSKILNVSKFYTRTTFETCQYSEKTQTTNHIGLKIYHLSTEDKKKFWKKVKILATNISPVLSRGCSNAEMFGKGLNLSQTSPGFYVFEVQVFKRVENPVRKGKIALLSNFSISNSVFYPFGELSAIFIKIKIVVCKLFQF